MASLDGLRKTPLFARHGDLGARLIDFGGWAMPVQYKSGIVKEHKAVRAGVGLFDVSHMGEVRVRGPKALACIQNLITQDASVLVDGAAVYTLMCYPDGGIVDDCIVYRRGPDDYLIIVNASNTEKDLAWIREHDLGAEIADESEETALIAVQGPKAVGLVDSLADGNLSAVARFHFADDRVAGVPCMVARTGYTGEDGFELACPADRAVELWDALLGGDAGAEPIGLGARDTLRLEARMCLYGNDIDKTTTPLEAGLSWAVKMNAGDFIGRDALVEQKERGIERKLIGFRIEGRGIARPGYDIVDRSAAEPVIGRVTSGTTGITVGGAIGMGYVPAAHSAAGTEITIDVRGKDIPAEVVKGPFYKRGQ